MVFDEQQIIHDHISYRYEILEVIGKGSFGQVVRALDYKTNKPVAIKIIRNKKRFHHQALVEVRILDELRKKDPDNTHNVIHMLDYFYFRNHLCISFELMRYVSLIFITFLFWFLNQQRELYSSHIKFKNKEFVVIFEVMLPRHYFFSISFVTNLLNFGVIRIKIKAETNRKSVSSYMLSSPQFLGRTRLHRKLCFNSHGRHTKTMTRLILSAVTACGCC